MSTLDQKKTTTPNGSVPSAPSPTGGFRPSRLLEVELGRRLPDIEPESDPDGNTYERILCLARVHDHPVGVVELDCPGGAIDATALAASLWHELGIAISAHLAEDGLEAAAELDEDGLPYPDAPPCQSERRALLADAPFASVIIPTRERVDHLERCIDSLLASDYPEGRFEVLVVDNVPETSDTEDLVTRRFPGSEQVRYVRADYPGSAYARNVGIEEARGDLLVFTDDDVLVDEHWLTEMVKGFSVAEGVGCVTGLILPLQLDTPAQRFFEEYGGFGKGTERRVYDIGRRRPDNPMFPYNAGSFGSGNSMAFTREALREIGGFDPALGNGTPARGGVDIEVFFAVLMTGKALVYEPAAIIHHLHRPGMEALRKQVYNYGVGLTAFLTKWLVRNPKLWPDFVRRVPAGVRFALSPTSEKHAGKSEDYPSDLRRLEVKGMLYGPVGYLRSARQFRRTAHGPQRPRQPAL